MQRIDFFPHLQQEKAPLLPARQQLVVVAGFAALLLLSAALLATLNSVNARKLAALQQQQQQLSSEVGLLEQRKRQLENDPQLTSDIARLQQGIQFRQRLMTTLGAGQETFASGFSAQLEGLARQAVQGLWFTDVQLQQGGTQMALAGHTRKPEFVPQLLQKLADEPVFQGQQFRVFRISTEEKAPALRFEVRSKEAGQ